MTCLLSAARLLSTTRSHWLTLKKRFLCLLCACLFATAATSLAQRPSNSARGPIEVEPIDQAEGREIIESFRKQRPPADSIYQFSFIHLPHRAAQTRYRGIMWLSWQISGPLIRVSVWKEGSPLHEHGNNLLIHGGENPKVWEAIADTSGQLVPKEVPTDQWLEPVLDDLVYTTFDLVMPFVYWDDFEYTGSKRLMGRPAHLFEMQAPTATAYPGIRSAEMALDADFNALRRVRLFGPHERHLKSFKILAFKQLADESYALRTIDLVDEVSRDKTRFRVDGAATGLQLPPSLFDPGRLADKLPSLEKFRFEYF